MTEIIEQIIEIENFKESDDDWSGYDGYKVITNQQEILLMIDNGQSCCENWGYFWLNDNILDFIGAELKGIDIVDTALNKEKFDDKVDLYEGDAMFVNLETSKGTLQFTLYNEHNGYYGHEAKIVSKQLTKEETL